MGKKFAKLLLLPRLFLFLLICLPLGMADPETRTSLPMDGGAPGKAFLECASRIQARKLEEAKKYLTAEALDYVTKISQVTGDLRDAVRGQINIAGGHLSGSAATLKVRMKYEGADHTYWISMVLDHDQWKWKDGKWNDAEP